MDWISALHYGLIRQQEWLHRARQPHRGFRVRAAFKWARTLIERMTSRARRSSGRRITPAGGPALPKDKALA